MLSHFLLLLHMMLLGFLEHLALEVNIDCLVKAYRFSEALWDLSAPSVVHIEEMDLYITNLQRFCLVHVISKKENLCLLQKFEAQA